MGILRLLLAIAVVLAHAGPLYGITLVGGVEAVEIFFMISGFYMALILHEKYTEPNSYKLFITNRFLRIFPIYWFVLLLTIIIFTVGYLFFNKGGILEAFLNNIHSVNPLIAMGIITSNIFLIGQDWLMLLDISNDGLTLAKNLDTASPAIARDFIMLPQAWTLSCELVFYFLAPLLLRLRTPGLLFLLTTTFIGRLIFSSHGLSQDPWTYRFFPFELGLFISGWLAYKIYSRSKSINSKFLSLVIPLVLITLIFTYQFMPDFVFKKWIFYSLIFLLLPLVFMVTKNNKFDRYLGELSYPIYVCHVFVIMILSVMHLRHPLYILIASLAFSIFLNTFIAKPFEVMREIRFKYKGA